MCVTFFLQRDFGGQSITKLVRHLFPKPLPSFDPQKNKYGESWADSESPGMWQRLHSLSVIGS